MLQFGKYKMDTNEIINQLREENEQLNLRLKNQDVMIAASLGVSGQIKKAAFELGYKDSMEATELDYLIETARALVMVNQKNVDLTGQRDALAAQVKIMSSALEKAKPHVRTCYKQSHAEWSDFESVTNALEIPPQHHLAAHDAEVAKAAFIAGYKLAMPTPLHNVVGHAENYVKSLSKVKA